MSHIDAIKNIPLVMKDNPQSLNTSQTTSQNITVVPDYMRDVYDWAYLNPRNVRLLDHEFIVSMILWGNAKRLSDALISEITPDMSILQAAHVYGDLIPMIADKLNDPSQLEVVDVSPIQLEQCHKKLINHPGAIIRSGDVSNYKTQSKDLVSSFFLLHEIPSDYKHSVVDNLLGHVKEGGKAVFIDYHRPHRFNPLKEIMRGIFYFFEPFAIELWDHDIKDYASHADDFIWSKETCFGGLYQKVVATRVS
jgi:SAM-dependent methyltransferase